MHRRNVKNAGLVGFVGGLAVVALASAAFACTSTPGKITITGINGTSIDGTSGGSVTYEGDGYDYTVESRGYCNGLPTRLNLETVAHPLDFSLAVAPFACPATPEMVDRVPDGLWEVRWVKAETEIKYEGLPRPICHFEVQSDKTTTENPQSRWVPLGPMTITDGSGFGQYPLPSTMVGPGNICVDKIRSDEDGDLQSNGTTPPVIFINKVNLI